MPGLGKTSIWTDVRISFRILTIFHPLDFRGSIDGRADPSNHTSTVEVLYKIPGVTKSPALC